MIAPPMPLQKDQAPADVPNDPRASTGGLAALFSPATIAIYGASTDAGSMGFRALANLRKGNFSGTIVPINPKNAGQHLEDTLWYRCAADYGRAIDHAVMLVRAETVLPLVEDCVEAGVRSLSILSGGFSEIGPEGAALQSRIQALTSAAGIRVLGPNCLGFVNAPSRVFASPAGIFEAVWPEGGPLAVVSQSGAVAADFLARSAWDGIDASFWVSTGNESDVAIADCIGYACDIEAVQVIALYLESIKDVAAFRDSAERARLLGKRIVAIRPGRTPAGIKAVRSHTAAMVTSDSLYDALFRRLGIMRVESQRELVDVVRVVACIGSRPRGLAIVSSSGGSGAMTADAASASGIPLAAISESGRARMRALVPACSPDNPIDVTGATNQNPGMLPDFFSTVLDEPEVDSMVMIHGASMMWRDRAEKISASLIAVAARYVPKRIVFVGTVDPDLTRALAQAGIAVFDDSVALMKAIGMLEASPSDSLAEPRITPQAEAPHEEDMAGDQGSKGRLLDEDEALDVLEHQIGVCVVSRAVVTEEASLAPALKALAYPLAMKAVIPGITHKTELGAVRIGIADQAAARAAWRELAAVCTRFKGSPKVLVETMVTDVVSEVLLSAFVDRLLGPFVTVGAGGTMTERLSDVSVAPAPVTRDEATMLLYRLKGWAHMARHRNGLVGNEDELIDAIVRVADAVAQGGFEGKPAIEQVEINPFMLRPSGSCAVDAVITVQAAGYTPH